MGDQSLVCPICRQRFDSEEQRLAHERSSHQVNRTGPSVEDVNTTVMDDWNRKQRRRSTGKSNSS